MVPGQAIRISYPDVHPVVPYYASCCRIVLLISDGKSSSEYGPPIPAAQALKTAGYIVFSIGVASINKDELLAIATSPSHVYMLKNFKYIVEVNDQLRNGAYKVTSFV